MKEFYSDYSAIGVGLVIGSAAHLGKLIAEGRVPSWLQLIGYFLQLGLVGLLCSVVTKQVGLQDPDFRALSAAILALSSQEVIQFLKRKARQPLLDALIRVLSDGNQKEGPDS